MSDKKAAVPQKGVRPNFTPNEFKGYRIRPDQWNWAVVQVKVKGEGSKDAGKEYESSGLSYHRDLIGAVDYIMRTAGALRGRRYQDETFAQKGIAADLNALTSGFREASTLAIAAIENLEKRTLQSGVALGDGITEEQKVAVFGLRGELKDVRQAFAQEATAIRETIGDIGKRAIELSLPVQDDKDIEVRCAATSEEWLKLREDYEEAYSTAMEALSKFHEKLRQVGLDPSKFSQHLLKAEGGLLGDDSPQDTEESEDTEEKVE